MSEPTSSAFGAALGWKLLGLGALISVGVAGALIMAAVDPPKDRKTLFFQGATAAIASLVFGPAAVKIADHYSGWIDLSNAPAIDALTWGAPVYFIVGALSWGAVGALSKLRALIQERAAAKVAEKAGL